MAKTEALTEIMALIDFHVTIATPRNSAKLHCTEKPLSNYRSALLLGFDLGSETYERRLDRMANGSIKSFSHLKTNVKSDIYPEFRNVGEIHKYDKVWGVESRTEGYYIGVDKVDAIISLKQASVSCTLLSATPYGEAEVIWKKLGPHIRESLDPDLQMILRGNTDSMSSKVIGGGYVAAGRDRSPQQRIVALPREVAVIDDDPNFLETACRLYYGRYGSVGFSSTKETERDKYPKMELSECLRNKQAVIYWGTSLPEVARLILDLREHGKGLDSLYNERKFYFYLAAGGNSYWMR